MDSQQKLIVFVLILIIIVFLLQNSNESEGYGRFSGPAYVDACEFQPECLWDTARTIQLSNGQAGVCTLHGIACPSFSKDHDRSRYAGMSPSMVGDVYVASLEAKAEGNFRPTGNTALDMLVE